MNEVYVDDEDVLMEAIRRGVKWDGTMMRFQKKWEEKDNLEEQIIQDSNDDDPEDDNDDMQCEGNIGVHDQDIAKDEECYDDIDKEVADNDREKQT